MGIQEQFSSRELDAIRDSVARAERRTSGEIVTYIVARSDAYPEAMLRAGCIGGAVAVVGAMAVFLLDPLRASFAGGVWFWTLLLAPLIVGSASAALCGVIEPLQRLLLARTDVDHRVRLRAEAAFLEEEVFATRERTGVLVFLSLFEHRAIVLADSGITARVDDSRWQAVIDDLCAGLRRGEEASSVERAVAACADILEGAGVSRRPDDEAELCDEPRLRER